MTSNVDFIINGRIISLEKFDNESNAFAAERSSFILFFENDPLNYELAIKYSFYHADMIFYGTIYNTLISNEVIRLRDIMISRRSQQQQ